MLDIKFIRENADKIKEAAKNKNIDLDVDELLRVDNRRRAIQVEIDGLRFKRNKLAEVGKSGKPSEEQIREGKELKNKIADLEEELKSIQRAYDVEEIRGANPRYWEDVTVGEELTPVVKGPVGITEIIADSAVAVPLRLHAHGVHLRRYKKHPAWAFRDPSTSAWEPVYGVHYNKAAANGAGLPYPYDVGAQRQGWLIHLMTNWIGDDGWLKKNYAEYRAFVYLSDVIRFKGKVTSKFVDEDGEYCAGVETSAINQRGENVMPGYSIVSLPSRKNNIWPLDKRLGGKAKESAGRAKK